VALDKDKMNHYEKYGEEKEVSMSLSPRGKVVLKGTELMADFN